MTAAEFTDALLEVEAALWGSFWQFDVIAPGSQLPAVELALLRAMRLDRNWPEGTTVEQFLADVRRALRQHQVGVWTLNVAGEPIVVVAGRKDAATLTVVWYCATTGRLHAAYRTETAGISTPPGCVEQSPLPSPVKARLIEPTSEQRWLAEVIEERQDASPRELAARLDVAILALRADYF